MGATTPFHCPADGCTYSTSFRLGMGEETDGDANRDRHETLRREHPNHPAPGNSPADPAQLRRLIDQLQE
jgi:hypothetical protein